MADQPAYFLNKSACERLPRRHMLAVDTRPRASNMAAPWATAQRGNFGGNFERDCLDPQLGAKERKMTRFSSRPNRSTTGIFTAFAAFALLAFAGCDDKHIGRPCCLSDVCPPPADAGAPSPTN